MKEEATFLTVKNKSSQQEFKINTEDILYAMKTEEESHAKPWIYMIDGKQFYYSNWHIDKIRYVVSNPEVLSVSKKGKITTKKAGKATVYAVAQNGVMNKIKIKVTK